MKTRIVRIGSSQGVLLPKSLLCAAGLGLWSQVEIELCGGELVIRPVTGARAGWEAAFVVAREREAGEGAQGPGASRCIGRGLRAVTVTRRR
jgi:antitoxin component of MazEF toxin-antitoxin module